MRLTFVALVTSMVASKLASLTSFKLRAIHDECRDEEREPTNLISDTAQDIESSFKMIRHLATLPQLTVLHLTGSHVVNAEFFHDLPPFPALVDFQLDFAAQTPDAKWFFVPDRILMARIKDFEEGQSVHEYDSDSEGADTVEYYDSDDEDGPLVEREDGYNQFRTMPSSATIPNFLIGAARTVESSTRLRKFILRHRHSSRDRAIFWNPSELIPYGRHLELWYLRSGVQPTHDDKIIPADESCSTFDRIYWRVGDRWRPDAGIVDAWRSAVGPAVKYCFLKDFYDYNGKSMTWQHTEDLQKEQYVLDVEWEEPGVTVNLEVGELKQPFERGIVVHGPWLEDSVFS